MKKRISSLLLAVFMAVGGASQAFAEEAAETVGKTGFAAFQMVLYGEFLQSSLFF